MTHRQVKDLKPVEDVPMMFRRFFSKPASVLSHVGSEELACATSTSSMGELAQRCAVGQVWASQARSLRFSAGRSAEHVCYSLRGFYNALQGDQDAYADAPCLKRGGCPHSSHVVRNGLRRGLSWHMNHMNVLQGSQHCCLLHRRLLRGEAGSPS